MTGLRIGNYELRNPWILAPMAGVSEMPFRVLARELGAAAAPTELVSAKGLLYGQERTRRYLAHAACERPFWVQLFGGDPESMAVGAERAAELGAEILDINMGCPVKKVTKTGAGSALLCDPRRAAAIVAAMTKRAGLPVTVKIRAGWDHDSIRPMEMVRAVADAGAVAVAIHARTRAQGYSGHADWSLITALACESPIPVIGNGDAFTAQAAQRMLRETGCAAVMIGRGALGNPWIFSQLHGEPPPTSAQRWQLVQRHLRAHVEHVGNELAAVRRFRPHLGWYAHGLRGAAKFREHVMRAEDLAAVEQLSAEFFSAAAAVHGEGVAAFDARSALG